MIIYPLLTECVYRVARWLAPGDSWIGKVTRSSDWKNQTPLQGTVLWMHCASLGEFEMGRPVLERFLERQKEAQAVVTFFSPSGYYPRKDYQGAKVHFLPFDAPSEIKKWLRYCNPTLAFFVRYDLWPNHLAGLSKRNIPVVVAAMSAPNRPWFLSPFLPLIRSLYSRAVHVWGVVETSDAQVLRQAGISAKVLGNPKFDYALSLTDAQPPSTFVSWKSVQNKPVLLVGSAHLEDVNFLKDHLTWENYCVWIVPHKVEEAAMLRSSLNPSLSVASDAENEKVVDVLFVETFGVLRSLYGLADHIFIGGGFGKAVHNVLEATAAGKAAASGPNTEKMPENTELIRHQLLVPCHQKRDLQAYLSRSVRSEKEKALKVLKAHSGAVGAIVEVLEQSV